MCSSPSKLLLDACVSASADAVLEAAGWQPRRIAPDPGDLVLLGIARDEQMPLVTLDRDFGEHAVLRGHSHFGIVRLVGLRALEHGPFALGALTRYSQELAEGAIVTVYRDRVRIRLR